MNKIVMMAHDLILQLPSVIGKSIRLTCRERRTSNQKNLEGKFAFIKARSLDSDNVCLFNTLLRKEKQNHE